MDDLNARAAAKQPSMAFRIMRLLTHSSDLWLCIDDIEDRTTTSSDGSSTPTTMVALVFAGLIIKSDERSATSRLGNAAHGYAISPAGEALVNKQSTEAIPHLVKIYDCYNDLKKARAQALANVKAEWNEGIGRALREIGNG